MDIVGYSLKNDVLWYKKGTTFFFGEDGGLFKLEGDVAVRTLDNLQNAIASHFADDGAEDYFKKVMIKPIESNHKRG